MAAINQTVLDKCPHPVEMNMFLNSMAGQTLTYQATVQVAPIQYDLLHKLADLYGVSYPEIVRTAINELLVAYSGELGND